MAYDEKLADRIREVLAGRKGLLEREMFGGIGFTIDGKMVAGVHGKDLIARAPAEEHSWVVKEPGARTFDMTGRPMKGWLLVGPAGTAKGPSLKKWVERSVSYVETLPAKKPMRKKVGPKKASGARRAKR
jgi:TfoX/Sxy family transcriptional regulator of competence genes